MGWEEDVFAVLDDLEQQAEAGFAAERELEVADRSRAEYQQVALAGRLMASVDQPVDVDVVGVGLLSGVLERCAASWCLLRAGGSDWVVVLAALNTVEGASERALPEVVWPPTSRLGLGSALRRLAEAGERCLVHRRDGGRHEGVPRRVGRDFVELAEGLDRLTLIALDGVAAVQSRG